jgi:hypothetical protein
MATPDPDINSLSTLLDYQDSPPLTRSNTPVQVGSPSQVASSPHLKYCGTSMEQPTIMDAISSFNEEHGTDLCGRFFEQRSIIYVDDLPLWDDDLTRYLMDEMDIGDEDIAKKFHEHLDSLSETHYMSLFSHAVVPE